MAINDVNPLSNLSESESNQERLQKALHQSEERQRLILENAKDYAILTIDLERRVNSWNPGAEAMFGYTEQEIIGQTGDILFVPEDRAKGVPQAEVQKAVEEGRAENERWHIRKNGSRFYGSGVTTSLREEDGTVRGLVKIMRDLTVQKHAEEALQVADRRKDEFLAMLSHELRNPLATLYNTLLLLELTQGKDPSLSLPKALSIMNREVMHLQRMVDDLLDVSRINRGIIQLRWERIDVNDWVRKAVEGVQSLYITPSRQLIVSTLSEPMYVLGDSTRLHQVLVNLLTNAIKYTSEHGHVWVSVEQVVSQSPEVLVRVRDDGIGLTAEQLTSVFDLFSQVNTSLDRPQGGLGLGLTVVKRLVEQHGGRVEARSAGLGQGSEFVIRLPALADADQPAPVILSDPGSTAPTLRVLVVDDNRDLADTTSMIVRRLGYDTHTRYGGEEAILAAERLRPHALLMDIGMPGTDGYVACQRVRQQPWGKSIFIVALTGYGEEKDKEQSKQAGFDAHLVKPIDFNVLTGLLASLNQYE